MKTYLSFNEILKVAFVPKLLNISLKNEISFVVLRIPSFMAGFFIQLKLKIKTMEIHEKSTKDSKTFLNYKK